jgi:hypothetical protein
MSAKKTLEEQTLALAQGRLNWLEPMQEWL